MPLIKLDHIHMAYGHVALLDDVSLTIEPGERLCLLGRNGEGKSTLLQILAGELPPDDGVVETRDGCRIARLSQEPSLDPDHTVFQAVASGLGELSGWLTKYHELVHAVAHDPTRMAELEEAQHHLEALDGWRVEQRTETVLAQLGLDPEARVGALSGGRQRRVDLGRALVRDPEVLLLDEPTNHLDVDTIEWMEERLLNWGGALLFISHDRGFAQRLATRIVALDRGKLRSYPGDYENYLRRRAEEWEAEEKQAAEFDKKLAKEEAWIRQGIKARRTRNMGRVRALKDLRVQRSQRRERKGEAKMRLDGGESSGKIVIETDQIRKSYPLGEDREICLVDNFSTTILRGDRIGLLGPNGAGKTTLLKMLLQELAPDSGKVRHGTKLSVAYFDQMRAQLDPEMSVRDAVAEGSDTLTVAGKPIHVMSYLANFLFAPQRAMSPIRSLSGGERNRLLLARLFSRPANLLVLDEPTNDLDMETLELLEELLMDYPGTLLLVSHDRAFLDNVVTSLLVFEGAGKISEIVGGYQEWLRFRDSRPKATPAPKPTPKPAPPAVAKKRKLSYHEQRELAELPERIDKLETLLANLQAQSAEPDFYRLGQEKIAHTLQEITELEGVVQAAYARWEELDD